MVQGVDKNSAGSGRWGVLLDKEGLTTTGLDVGSDVVLDSGPIEVFFYQLDCAIEYRVVIDSSAMDAFNTVSSKVSKVWYV